jgi:hypothetical protein
VAQGIVRSTEWQQYTDGRSKGCYPDSWDLVENAPRPADINPENILMNEFRLRDRSPEVRCVRLERDGGFAYLNSAADIVATKGGVRERWLDVTLRAENGFPAYAVLAPVDRPARVDFAGGEVRGSQDLEAAASGWFHDAELRAVVLKSSFPDGTARCRLEW